MSLSQWDQNNTANCTITLTSSAIIGSKSLSMASSTVGNYGAFINPNNSSAYVKGLDQGRLRTLIRQDGTGAGMGCGLCVIGKGDVLATDNTSYCYRYELFSTGQYGLERINANTCVVGNPGTILASGSTTITEGTVYSIQMDYIIDVPNLGGVHLTIYKGTLTNFSDLAILTQYLDSSPSKLMVPASEGLYFRGVTSVALMRAAIFDSTELFTMIIA